MIFMSETNTTQAVWDRTAENLGDGVHWIGNCYPVHQYHMHISEYLLQGDRGTVLIDSGAEQYRESITARIRELTDGRGPDSILLTHSTLPHTENVRHLKDEWPDAQVITASSVPSIVGLPDAKPWRLNETVDVQGRRMSFLDPLLTDVVLSQWVFDHDSRILFTAEAIGNYHHPGDCTDVFVGDHSIRREYIERYYADKLPFLWYVDSDRLTEMFSVLLDDLDVEYIAPMHGNPIHRSHMEQYLSDLCECIDDMDSSTFAERTGQ